MRLVTSASSHPIRRDIIDALMTHGPLSPKTYVPVANHKEGGSIENVSYHFRKLRDQGLIREHHTAQVRGALQHFYALNPEGLIAEARDLERRARQLRQAARNLKENP